MSAPLKPWERPGVNQRSDVNSVMQNQSRPSDIIQMGDTGGGGLPSVTAAPSAPPPLPARPSQQTTYPGSYGSSYGGYGGYGGGLGSYGGFGSYSPMYGGYGGYGMGNYGLNRYGQPGYGSSGFVRMAEDSSRQAFQSIESIVQAFGSVAMMLESTYSAVFNSFRAVLGVADHFSRMRTHFAQIFSAFAVIRTLRWLFRRLLVLLRLRESGMAEDAWAAATADTANVLLGATGSPASKPRSSWPIMLFFAVVIGGPWLIWKFLSSLTPNQDSDWVNGDGDHFVAVSQFDFQGDSEEELSFRQGQRINIAPKELQPRVRGWLLGSVDGKKTGLIPANYVKILGKRRGRKQLVNSAASQQPPANGNAVAAPASSIPPSRSLPNLEEMNTTCEQSNSWLMTDQDLESSFSTVTPNSSENTIHMPQHAVSKNSSVVNKEASEILEDSNP